mmetsp:Transcript_80816/g.227561  ORF Transcript_80816/g.227561 Transcript_80816/m.227561 type:complete len:216 (-) Transcript_80816:1669-2316(-)
MGEAALTISILGSLDDETNLRFTTLQQVQQVELPVRRIFPCRGVSAPRPTIDVEVVFFVLPPTEAHIHASRDHEAEHKVAENEGPEERVAVMPDQLGHGGCSIRVLEVHAIDTGEELDWGEDRGHDCQEEQDVVLSVGLRGPSHLLLLHLFRVDTVPAVTFLVDRTVVCLAQRHAFPTQALAIVRHLVQVLDDVLQVRGQATGDIAVINELFDSP